MPTYYYNLKRMRRMERIGKWRKREREKRVRVSEIGYLR